MCLVLGKEEGWSLPFNSWLPGMETFVQIITVQQDKANVIVKMCMRNYKIASEGSSTGPTKKIHRKLEQTDICPFESNEKNNNRP